MEILKRKFISKEISSEDLQEMKLAADCIHILLSLITIIIFFL